ncbi:hypothetical protein [Rhodopirellula sp. MGV]|nr:hypothetical protein [Rhodopirellula sp. MGV]
MLRLVTVVERGLELLAKSRESDDRFDSDLSWSYHTFVRAYFVEAAT